MTRFRTPFDWEVSEAPRRLGENWTYFGMKAMSVELCPDCTESHLGPGAIDTYNLCPACRLVVEARW